MKPILAFTIVCLVSLPCMAQCLHKHHGHGCCVEGCCPECKMEDNEKSCFCVECEKICIPAVKFPWENCCIAKPGKVKVVRRVAKKDYTCGQKKVWEWPKPEKVPCCNTGHGCGGGCGLAGCADCCDSGCGTHERVRSGRRLCLPGPPSPGSPHATRRAKCPRAGRGTDTGGGPSASRDMMPLVRPISLFNKARGVFRVRQVVAKLGGKGIHQETRPPNQVRR